MLEEARNEPRVVNYHKVTLKKKHRRNHSQRASGENHSRQEKSIANNRQSKPKDCDRDKAKYDEKHTTEESSSQSEGQKELKLGEVITTIPKINFNEETVEYKNVSNFYLKGTSQNSGKKRRLKDLVKKRSQRKSHRSEIVNVKTHSLSLKQMCDEVAEWRAGLSQLSS